MRYAVRVGETTVRIEVDPRGRVLADERPVPLDVLEVVPGRVYSILVDGRSHEVVVLEQRPLRVRVDGREVPLELVDEREEEASGHTPLATAAVEVRAPMPGLIVAVHVSEGDVVQEGDSVCTLEAMKMENEIAAPRGGRVARLGASAGTKVNAGDLLAVVSPL